MSAKSDPLLSIGAVADRTGLAPSAIRFYEEQGLISAERAPSGHRRFLRSTIRRLSFIRICQQLGYSLDEVSGHLDALPDRRTPSEADWQAMSTRFAADVEHRIARLQDLREKLDGCIGCGCLSLQRCQLYNRDDHVKAQGQGPRLLLQDE